MKYFYINWIIAVIAVVVTTILPTFTRVSHLEKYEEKVQAEIDELKDENKRLQTEIKALQSDPYFLETTLRTKFHMVREGEVVLK